MNKKNIRRVDHLTEDAPIVGQTYVCVSFLSPEGIRNCKVRGLKVRGVYGTREEADKQAKSLQSDDPDFHVFVGEVGKWLPWDPDPNSATDQEYREEELQKLMESYKKNRENVKTLEQERKANIAKKASVDNEKLKTINRLRKKLEMRNSGKSSVCEAKDDDDINNKQLSELEKSIKEQENLVKDTRRELNSLRHDNVDRENNRGSSAAAGASAASAAEDDLESKLARIAELHDSIIKN